MPGLLLSPKGANLSVKNLFIAWDLKPATNCFLWVCLSKWHCQVLCCLTWTELERSAFCLGSSCFTMLAHTPNSWWTLHLQQIAALFSACLFVHFAFCFRLESPLRVIVHKKWRQNFHYCLHRCTGKLCSVVFFGTHRKTNLQQTALQLIQKYLVAKARNFTGRVVSLLDL